MPDLYENGYKNAPLRGLIFARRRSANAEMTIQLQHAGVNCEGHQKDKRERLCRYIARPAVAVPRLSLSSTGKVLYTLKTPYGDGTTQVAFVVVNQNWTVS